MPNFPTTPTSTVLIRPATAEDVPTVFALIKALADYEKLSDAVSGSVEALAEHLFGRPCIETVLAEQDGKPVGFALFFNSYSTFLAKPGIYLEDLFVRPDYRGQGIGKALLSNLAQRVLQRNGGRLEWSVLDWNEPAIAFYRQIGATIGEDTRICRITRDRLPDTAALGESEIEATLRPVMPDDMPGLFQLIQSKAQFDRQKEFSSDPTALSQHLFGSPRYLEGWVVEQAGQLIGFATFSPNYSTFLTQPGIYLEDLFVLPEYRAQGIGKTLLARLAQIALDRHCGRLEWLVATWNERAIAFYQHMGATVLPDWRICRMTGEAIEALARNVRK
jgi:GNAT superfamily N-acetyltransferase